MGRLFLGSGGIILRRLWGEVGDECLEDKCLLVWMRERIEWDVFV